MHLFNFTRDFLKRQELKNENGDEQICVRLSVKKKTFVAGKKFFIVQSRAPDLKFQARIAIPVHSRRPYTLSSIAISDTFLFRLGIPDYRSNLLNFLIIFTNLA